MEVKKGRHEAEVASDIEAAEIFRAAAKSPARERQQHWASTTESDVRLHS